MLQKTLSSQLRLQTQARILQQQNKSQSLQVAPKVPYVKHIKMNFNQLNQGQIQKQASIFSQQFNSNHRFFSSQQTNQEQDIQKSDFHQLKSEIQGESAAADVKLTADDLVQDKSNDSTITDSEKNFQEVLDKYYNEIEDANQRLSDDQHDFEQKLDDKVDTLNYFHQQSSSYYKISQDKFDSDIKSFENKLTESKSCMSDLRFSDGFGGRGRPISERDDENVHQNHTYNIYEHYRSGYESTMDMPKTKVAQAFALPFIVSIICGFFIFSSTQPKNGECEALAIEAVRNKLESRASILVNPSNEPCEDRFNCYQFKNIEGYYQAVFDGHAGWQVAEFAMKNMHMYIDEELGKSKKKGEKEIKDCITKAFERVEADWVNTARTAFHAGYPHAARVGACALVAVVVDNKLYVANAGDSKAALIRKNGDIYERIKVSKTFNANKKYEQERLRNTFKSEKDVVICKRGGEGACYVKGRLMPTRALGDLQLKHDEFNFHNYSPENGYRQPIRKENYTGPYIGAVPDVQVFDLSEDDKFLVLASDGLWDELNRKEAANVATKLSKSEEFSLDRNSLTKQLMGDALDHAAKSHGISRSYLSQISPGRQKRGLVDDITIVIVDMKNQFKK